MTESTYVSRRLQLSHDVAAEAVDRWLVSLTPCGWRGRRAKASRHLVLDRQISLNKVDNCVLGQLKASLSVWGKPTRVEIEVRKWSHESCEVGLRSMTMHWPVLTDQYVALASQTLEELAAELVLIAGENASVESPVFGRTSPIALAQDRPLALVS